MKIAFIKEKFFLGGAETLIIRMVEWLNQNSIETIILTAYIDNSIEDNLTYFQNQIQTIEFGKNLKKYIQEQNITHCCVVTLNDYIRISWQDNYQVLLYVLHSGCLTKGYLREGYIINFFKNIYSKLLKKTIRNLDSSKSIIFMDTQTKTYTEKFFHIKLKSSILPLPIKVMDNEVIKKGKNRPLAILTISRAEFPFKAYMIGLIDIIKNFNKDIYLTIISYGEDISILKKKINKADNVKLIEGVPYNQIDEYIKKSDVYIGMGTTLLDAAKYGVISIPVSAYKYECCSPGYFYDYPFNLGYYSNDYIDCTEIIKEIVEMDDHQYFEKCKKTYEALLNTYSIDNIMPKFLNNLENSKKLHSYVTYSYLKTINFLFSKNSK